MEQYLRPLPENAKRIEAVAVVLGIDTSLVAETISEMEIEK